MEDLLQFAKNHSLATVPKIKAILNQVTEAIRNGTDYAMEAKVSEQNTTKIGHFLKASAG